MQPSGIAGGVGPGSSAPVVKDTVVTAARDLAAKFATQGAVTTLAAAKRPPLEGTVVAVKGDHAVIARGQGTQVSVGDSFVVLRDQSQSADPGALVRVAHEPEQVGTATVAEVNDSYYVIQVTGKVSVGDTVRPR